MAKYTGNLILQAKTFCCYSFVIGNSGLGWNCLFKVQRKLGTARGDLKPKPRLFPGNEPSLLGRVPVLGTFSINSKVDTKNILAVKGFFHALHNDCLSNFSRLCWSLQDDFVVNLLPKEWLLLVIFWTNPLWVAFYWSYFSV